MVGSWNRGGSALGEDHDLDAPALLLGVLGAGRAEAGVVDLVLGQALGDQVFLDREGPLAAEALVVAPLGLGLVQGVAVGVPLDADRLADVAVALMLDGLASPSLQTRNQAS